jgi:hypothetical protein
VAALGAVLLLGGVAACGGTPGPVTPGSCDATCSLLSGKCGGTTGAIGLLPGGCLGACSAASLGPAGGFGVSGCVTAATTCDAAQACVMAAPADGGTDGNPISGLDLGGPPDTVGPSADRPINPDAPSCGTETPVNSTQLIPNILLVLDTSGSMTTCDFGSGSGMTTRIKALKSAMQSLLGQMALQGKIRWGMTNFPFASARGEQSEYSCVQQCGDCDFCAAAADPFYSSPQCDCLSNCIDPNNNWCSAFSGMPEVPVGDGNESAITSAVNALIADGNTPTSEALKAAKTYLTGIADPNHPSYVLLGTDGEPTCSDDGTGSATVQATTDLANAGIKTFVVGIASNSQDSDVLNQIATAGGTAQMGSTKYYDAQNEMALATALTSVAGSIASCSYKLDMPAPNPLLINVYVNGMPLPRDAMNGFSYTVDGMGNATITLNGTSCSNLMAADMVQIKFGCRTGG